MRPVHRNQFSYRKRLKSFRYAFSGILKFLESEHNSWIHLTATIVVTILAILLSVSRMEALFLTIVVAVVWIMELINSAIEKTMDFISHEQKQEIKWIKDLAAAAVLVASITALAVGCIVFIPKVMQ